MWSKVVPRPNTPVIAPARLARMPGAASRASGSLKRDPARTSAALACEAGVDPGTGSGHRAAMLGQLLLTDNGGLTWHAVTF